MINLILTDELIKECYKTLNMQNNGKESKWNVLANEFGYAGQGEQLRQKFKAYRKKIGDLPSQDEIILRKHGYIGYNQTKTFKETVGINKDGSQDSEKLIGIEDDSKLKDEKFLLDIHGYDSRFWEIVSSRNSIWNAQLKGGDVTKMYASKINVKPRVKDKWTKEDAKEIFDFLNNEPIKKVKVNQINIISKKSDDKRNLLVVPIADFHYNLLADKFSTGNEYNIEIAEESFYKVIDEVMQSYKNVKFEKVLFTVGNDFINADNIQGSTTKGTPQDNATSWFEAKKGATSLIRSGIENLKEIAPLDLLNVPSNHDMHTMFGVCETLSAWYRNEDNVKIINNPLPNQYYNYENNLMCFAHDMKIKDSLQTITSQGKRHWSNANNIMCILAHLHGSMRYEKQGELEVLRLPTFSGWSRWSNSMNYIQSEKECEVFVVNSEYGITDKKIIHI